MSQDGLLLVDKPAGVTSHDVVQQARRALRIRRIGHCGTLDPAATGLLLLTVGHATRLTRFLIRAPKVYEGEIRLGISTDTYDAAGVVVSEAAVAVDDQQIELALRAFEGSYEQLPPAYSAKKIGGRKYYELARRGEPVPQEPTTVEIYELRSTGPLQGDRFGFRLACSSGTYARAVAHDLGQRLGCGAHLCQLTRTRIGGFALEAAVPANNLTASAAGPAAGGPAAAGDPSALGSAWIPFDAIPLPFSEVLLDALQERRVQNGQTVLAPGLEAEEGDWLKMTNPRGQFIAVGTVVECLGAQRLGVIQPRIVFP